MMSASSLSPQRNPKSDNRFRSNQLSSGNTPSQLPSPVPMISYSKKSRNNAPKDTKSILSPTPTGTRQVLSHRKKLQEFYKLHPEHPEHSDSAGNPHIDSDSKNQLPEPASEAGTATGVSTDVPPTKIEQLKDPRELEKFVKETSAHKMLKLRNEIALKLNLHDLEKKTIIYDNYSELIKLDHTLGSVKNGTLDKIEEDRFLVVPKGGKKDFKKVLADVRSDVERDSAIFNQDFRCVVNSLLTGPEPNET